MKNLVNLLGSSVDVENTVIFVSENTEIHIGKNEETLVVSGRAVLSANITPECKRPILALEHGFFLVYSYDNAKCCDFREAQAELYKVVETEDGPKAVFVMYVPYHDAGDYKIDMYDNTYKITCLDGVDWMLFEAAVRFVGDKFDIIFGDLHRSHLFIKGDLVVENVWGTPFNNLYSFCEESIKYRTLAEDSEDCFYLIGNGWVVSNSYNDEFPCEFSRVDNGNWRTIFNSKHFSLGEDVGISERLVKQVHDGNTVVVMYNPNAPKIQSRTISNPKWVEKLLNM